jgi:hypothetical protein
LKAVSSCQGIGCRDRPQRITDCNGQGGRSKPKCPKRLTDTPHAWLGQGFCRFSTIAPPAKPASECPVGRMDASERKPLPAFLRTRTGSGLGRRPRASSVANETVPWQAKRRGSRARGAARAEHRRRRLPVGLAGELLGGGWQQRGTEDRDEPTGARAGSPEIKGRKLIGIPAVCGVPWLRRAVAQEIASWKGPKAVDRFFSTYLILIISKV